MSSMLNMFIKKPFFLVWLVFCLLFITNYFAAISIVYAAHCTGAPCGGHGGSAGTSGSVGNDGLENLDGWSGGGGGGGGGSAAGGSGGHGAGGGLLIKNASGTMTISGTIDTRGGNSSTTNGGTVKLFYTGSAPSTAGISAGRIYTDLANPGSSPSGLSLVEPTANATNVRGYPVFRLRATDAENDYLQYMIDICNNNDCSSIFRTIDQSASQTGWSGQDALGNTAYVGSSTLSSSTIAIHTLQVPGLTASTQYWWRAYAKDPVGTNTFSSASAIQTFTIDSIKNVEVRGGTNINGGGHIR